MKRVEQLAEPLAEEGIEIIGSERDANFFRRPHGLQIAGHDREHGPRRIGEKRIEVRGTNPQSNVGRVIEGFVHGCRLVSCQLSVRTAASSDNRQPTTLPLLQPHLGHQDLDIVPHLPLGGRVAQHVGGMISAKDLHAVEVDHPAAELADGRIDLQQVLRGAGAKATYELRLDDRQLGVEVLAAVGRLHRQRRTIVRRPAAEDVHDVNVLAAKLHAFGDDVGKQLTRPADKRFALPIFVRARGLADKDQVGMRIADAENRLRAIFDQYRAALQAATRLATSARASSREGPEREAGSGERGAERAAIASGWLDGAGIRRRHAIGGAFGPS